MFADYLDGLRELAEARMVESSTATVRRLTGRTAQNESTGLEVPEWEIVHTGPFRLGGADRGGSGARTETIAGVEVQLATRVAHFPYSAEGIADGDLIDVTAGENAGAVLRILEADWQDQATARRFPVIATERPEEWV